ncbi:pyridoxal-phosphate dependent enzyme, partial [Aquabacterium sp. A08]|uniref:pyridoxal-phosphate dependent enzyme n=1 Tax=Aquabacterium sp. A08 TaxID=2718532 RepID=UPI00141F5126
MSTAKPTPATAPARKPAARRKPRSYPTIEAAIGNTPLVALQRIGAEVNRARGNVVLGKLEGNNPAGSVKDRPALSMIQRAQERG